VVRKALDTMSKLEMYSTMSSVQFNRLPWIMLTVLLITQITVAFVGRSIAPLGPLIEADLSLTKAQIGMLPAALFLGQTLISIPSGFLCDRFGSRVILLALSVSLGASFFLFSFVSHFSLVLLFVVLGGFGYGAMHPTSTRGITYWFPVQKRGAAMGIKQMGVTGGSSLAAIILLPLAVVYGWRLALVAASIFLVIIGIAAFFLYRDPPEEHGVASNKHGLKEFFTEMRGLLKNKYLLVISIAASGLAIGQLSFATYIVFFMHEKMEFSLYIAGLMFVVAEVFGSIGRIVWGIVSDRLFSGGRLIILTIIAIATAVNSIVISFIPAGFSIIFVFLFVALFGFCIAGFNGIWMNSASEAVPKEQSGIASGFSLMLGSLGVVVGPPIFGAIVDYTGIYTFAWLFLAAVMVGVTGLLLYAKHLGESKA
jgi:ACS family hexuronate transporter-like MFS transporter